MSSGPDRNQDAKGGSVPQVGPDPPAHPKAASGPSPFPGALRRFVELFNRGEHWESHEVLEGPWRQDGSRFYHGLILFASAFVHVKRDNPHGIDAQMRKTLEALEGFPEAYLGLDVEGVRSVARAARREVASGIGGRPWAERVPAPRLVLDPAALRGDEPEAGL